MSIYIESLRWPEHEDTEEVRTRDPCDEQSQSQNSWVLLQALWEHGVLCEPSFPDDERDDEYGAQD